MSILKVACMGHPVLRRKADDVSASEINSPWFKQFVADMLETMVEYGGVGLAAPQVHVSKRVVIIGSAENARYAGYPDIPLMILVNPVVTPRASDTYALWEGCLSVPGLRGHVERPRLADVIALDEKGQRVEFKAEDFKASVVQHEVDHLDGILFPKRMKDLGLLMFQAEYERYMLLEGGSADEEEECR